LYKVDVDNSSFKRLMIKVVNIRPEAKWSNHEQVESKMETFSGGLNSYLLQKIEMICGLEWKANQT